ncbi:MAG: polysaccharide biosynthesis C-terminal domain-containing protein [bacterium]|nr:polysaccharide biosynthesis C-terminal domain-containing protein [bacterium]
MINIRIEKKLIALRKKWVIKGELLATIGMILSSVLGIFYVIPFYSMIGDYGGTLYGCAYSIYLIFFGIYQVGTFLAIRKIVEEYHILGYYRAKERAFQLGQRMFIIVGLIGWLLLFIFAGVLADVIVGDIVGGSIRGDLRFGIRVISFSLFIVPLVHIYRGYLQGQKCFVVTSISQTIEQSVRVIVLVVGVFLAFRVFHFSFRFTVGIALLATAIGAFVSYFYLFVTVYQNRKQLQKKILKVKEPKITDSVIISQIVRYAFPFIMVDVFKAFILSVDVFLLVRLLVDVFGYTVQQVEVILSIMTTWGLHLNMAFVSIAVLFVVRLMPNLRVHFVNQNLENIRVEMNLILQKLFFLAFPLTFLFSILSKPIWTVFYGVSKFGSEVYQYYVFVSFATLLFIVAMFFLQILQEYKRLFLILFVGVVTNVLFYLPLLYGFYNMGLPAYYGAITSMILSCLICSMMALHYLGKKYQINYEQTIKRVLNIIIITLVMVIVILAVLYFIRFHSNVRILNLFMVIMCIIVGMIIYFGLMFRTRLVYDIFGYQNVKKIENRIRKKVNL